MKKLIMVSIIFIFAISIFNNSKKNTIHVFNEINDNNKADYFYIKSKDNDLNSSNILKYINDDEIKIIGIYPNLDNIFDKKIKKKLEYYNFSLISNNQVNVNSFINNYVSVLKNNNYIEIANKVYFDGIKINKIQVYTSYKKIQELKEKFNNLFYEINEL